MKYKECSPVYTCAKVIFDSLEYDKKNQVWKSKISDIVFNVFQKKYLEDYLIEWY